MPKNLQTKLRWIAIVFSLFMIVGMLVACESDECSHHWGEWSVKTQATCTETGTRERKCFDCGKAETSSIGILSHTWEDATCTEPKTCTVCQATEGATVAHTGGSATCKSKAECSLCGTKYGELAAHTPNLDDGDCTTAITCSICGSVTTNAKSHAFDNDLDANCNNIDCEHTREVENVPEITKPMFIISSTTASAGETNVEVTVALKNNPGIASIKLIVSYDEGLTLKNIAYNSSIGGMSQQPQTKDSPVILNWFNGTANSTGDWVFATLTFDIAANASGEYDITFTYDPNDVYNIAETNIYFDAVAGKIVIS